MCVLAKKASYRMNGMCFVQSQIVMSGRVKKNRGIPRPGGDFVAPGNKVKAEVIIYSLSHIKYCSKKRHPIIWDSGIVKNHFSQFEIRVFSYRVKTP